MKSNNPQIKIELCHYNNNNRQPYLRLTCHRLYDRVYAHNMCILIS